MSPELQTIAISVGAILFPLTVGISAFALKAQLIDLKDTLKDLGAKVNEQSVALAQQKERMVSAEKDISRMSEEIRLMREHYHDLAGKIAAMLLKGYRAPKPPEAGEAS